MKTVMGLVSAAVGFVVAVLAISFMAKPSNMPVTFDPGEALATYFFSFSWAGGWLGSLIGVLLLVGYLALWFALGTKVYSALTRGGGT